MYWSPLTNGMYCEIFDNMYFVKLVRTFCSCTLTISNIYFDSKGEGIWNKKLTRDKWQAVSEIFLFFFYLLMAFGFWWLSQCIAKYLKLFSKNDIPLVNIKEFFKLCTCRYLAYYFGNSRSFYCSGKRTIYTKFSSLSGQLYFHVT